MTKVGVQQVLLSPDKETKSILEYLCQQSGKLYNTGIYFARQTFFKTGKLLTGKFDLDYEPSISKSTLKALKPSTLFTTNSEVSNRGIQVIQRIT